MKKIHILLLVLIAGAIAVLVTFLKGASTYETVAEAKSTPDKFVHVAVKLDKSLPVEYNAQKDPNYLSFHAIDAEDSTQRMKVVYRKGEIPNLMISEKLVLKGKFEKDHFECRDVQTKCPSKYKDDMKAAEKKVQDATQNMSSENSSANK
ncbi:MAG: cytochrome c maturation protein CcmE [Sphingobacteriales bacterium]|nr:cytochrome c maturation protein CcmE [Sphingobacteriales bacterium]